MKNKNISFQFIPFTIVRIVKFSTPSHTSMSRTDHPRLLLRGFLSPDLCKELEFIHRSSSAVGYRPNVLSTTLSHLIATNCGHLIVPFVAVREKIKEKVEEFFGCEFELFVEFTGLISWCKGAFIGWHSDDNRPYLQQRDFAAVCYLNNHGKDFKGGIFHFKDGEPSSVEPVAGDVLIYTADSRNIHSVDEVLDGERITLTLWFTRNSAHDEDAKLISFLSQSISRCGIKGPGSYAPLPASENMYWFSENQLGFDIRFARIHILGFHLFPSINGQYKQPNSSQDPVELLDKPLRIGRDDETFDKEFANSLHVLQVVQFYYWKAHALAAARSDMKSSQPLVIKNMSGSELVLPCNHQLMGRISSHTYDNAEHSFNWDEFTLAVEMWEEYISSLHKCLLTLMPYWVSHQSIFFINSLDPSEM